MKNEKTKVRTFVDLANRVVVLHQSYRITERNGLDGYKQKVNMWSGDERLFLYGGMGLCWWGILFCEMFG